MPEHPGGSGFLHPKPQKKCGFICHYGKSKATLSDSTFYFDLKKLRTSKFHQGQKLSLQAIRKGLWVASLPKGNLTFGTQIQTHERRPPQTSD